MNETWKVMKTEDGREFLSILHKTDSLETSNAILQKVMPLVIKYEAQYETSISLSDENILITLHGQSTGPINETDWKLAEEIILYLQ
jgi:hypothetical protein